MEWDILSLAYLIVPIGYSVLLFKVLFARRGEEDMEGDSDEVGTTEPVP